MDIEFEDNSEGMINVNGCDDPYYRYKMEPLYVITTDAKGGTTIVCNLQGVSEAIYRTMSDLRSYYSKHLGLNARIKGGELYIPGRFAVKTLQDILQLYIESNVLCTECKSPETHSEKDKDKDIYRCYACGHLMRH